MSRVRAPLFTPERKARVDHDPGLFRTSPRVSVRRRAHDIDAEQFETLVVAELDLLPDDMIDGLENVVFVVEDRPEDGSLDLLGLYDGVALTERGQYGFGEMPDRIVLYREPLLELVDDLDELKEQIHVTLVHEIAHFYGIDDTRLHELGWG
jgi:predicted Zn-dependent protease with MMP-like domain